MRTLAEIKEAITADFMRNEAAAATYGFTPEDHFSTHFRPTSIESILFSVVAYAIWLLEAMFDLHRSEVEGRIEEILPHRPKWYRDKALGFMKDKTLIEDTDRYDTAGMSDQQIAEARVIRHAVATENSDSSILTIKVAGESQGQRVKLDAATEEQLKAYLAEIKDAGVRIGLVNVDADTFNCAVDIYYDPILQPADVEAACRAAIEEYIENLPFNGEYTNMALIDRLQAVEGVVIPEMAGASTSPAGDTAVIEIDARYVPVAGYFRAGTIKLNMKV